MAMYENSVFEDCPASLSMLILMVNVALAPQNRYLTNPTLLLVAIVDNFPLERAEQTFGIPQLQRLKVLEHFL